MDAKVDDFFNEINQIAPPKQDEKESLNDWEECYDEQSGYTYYWNIKTNAVTWDTPLEFNSQSSRKIINKKGTPSITTLLATKQNRSLNKDLKVNQKFQAARKPFKPSNDSEDEKIEIITSYGSDSDSEPEKDRPLKNTSSRSVDENWVSDEDVGDILQKIQKRVQELKEENKSKEPHATILPNENSVPVEHVASSQSAISLIAGYSDSEEENEETFTVPNKSEVLQVSHSTLFPIATPVDIRDFTSENTDMVETKENPQFDNKVFKRKRRIGIALVNTGRKKEEDNELVDNERKGLGFGKESPSSVSKKDKMYQNFAKGEVMFVKKDVLIPSITTKNDVGQDNEPVINPDDVNHMYSTLREKLNFLNVGRPDISPVQVMLIQAEMLFVAMNEGGLKLSYLQKWLSETCSELIKLEKEATPEGWQLQWDRQHKRYFYRNETTGTCQWEYPSGPATICRDEHGSDSDAMDISTTPPPEGPFLRETTPPPPSPPRIRCPTPPPPPTIHGLQNDETKTEIDEKDTPKTHDTVPVKKFISNGEPLPPGVDLPEAVSDTQETKTSNQADPLNSALNSFYSDIAAISNTNSSISPQLMSPPVPEESDQAAVSVEPAKKKKKTKVKLAAGLGMKKKGVIQLVEKWKHVQQNYQE